MLRRLLDSPRTYFVGAGVLAIAAIASQFELRLPARDAEGIEALSTLRERDDLNVVFILVDTLRADRLGIYGYGRPTSPTLDELARSGIVFERVVAQSSWTKTSMASLWTGAHPVSHGVLRYNHALPAEALLPAEIFRDAGFRTAGIWRNGWVSPNFGFGQGFETYIRPNAGRERKEILRRHPGTHKLRGTDEDLAQSAVEFLDTFGEERFLLYLHFMDVHQYVFDEAASKFGTSYSDAYDQSINWMDRVVGYLMRNFEERGLLDETLIVIASDHGEEFREHGSEGHARTLHREVIYVPLIFVLPFRLEPGVVVNRVVSNIDVWPTILDLVGLPPLPKADGVSLVPTILAAVGQEPAPEDGPRPLFSQLDRRWGRPSEEPDAFIAVTAGDLRLMMPLDDPDAARLYDLAADPMEGEDVAGNRPEAVAPLREALSTYAGGGRSPWGAPPDEVELDAMRLDQLRALGYVIR
jgi:arylsulfatase A-like enzyme